MTAIWPVQSIVFAAPPGLLSPSFTIVHNCPTQTLFGWFVRPCLLCMKRGSGKYEHDTIVHDGLCWWSALLKIWLHSQFIWKCLTASLERVQMLVRSRWSRKSTNCIATRLKYLAALPISFGSFSECVSVDSSHLAYTAPAFSNLALSNFYHSPWSTACKYSTLLLPGFVLSRAMVCCNWYWTDQASPHIMTLVQCTTSNILKLHRTSSCMMYRFKGKSMLLLRGSWC